MVKLQVSLHKNGEDKVLSSKCHWAKSSLNRLVGLLGHSSLADGESMLIEPCKQVHTFFMRFPIDVVFLSEENQVLDVREMKPWRVSPLLMKARKVLELQAGTCAKLNLEKGQTLNFTPKEEPQHARA